MAPNREWTAEEKLNIVLEALRGDNMAEVCRRHEVSPALVHRWRGEALEAARQRLSDHRKPSHRDPWAEENRKLRELAGKQALMLEAQKKLLGDPSA